MLFAEGEFFDKGDYVKKRVCQHFDTPSFPY